MDSAEKSERSAVWRPAVGLKWRIQRVFDGPRRPGGLYILTGVLLAALLQLLVWNHNGSHSWDGKIWGLRPRPQPHLLHRGRHYEVEKPAAQSNITSPVYSNDCNALLDLPRVTIMFLSRGAMPHEPLWRDWLASAAGLLPLQYLQDAACDEDFASVVQRVCVADPLAAVLERQFLFNVISHPAVEFEGHPSDNLFNRTVVEERLPTEWGTYKLTAAVKVMLRQGLEDPHAQQFLLLSDTDVPIYPPTVTWLQLMGESKSRINGCKFGSGNGRPTDTWEWPKELASTLTLESWRKSPQWFGLRRPHVLDVMNDEVLWPAFQRHCRNHYSYRRWHQCFVDEHYMPTLMGYLGKDQETDCKGHLAEADWTKPGSHGFSGPYEYFPADVTPQLIRRLRTEVDWGLKQAPEICHADAAIRLAERGFTSAAELTTGILRCEGPDASDIAREPEIGFARHTMMDTVIKEGFESKIPTQEREVIVDASRRELEVVGSSEEMRSAGEGLGEDLEGASHVHPPRGTPQGVGSGVNSRDKGLVAPSSLEIPGNHPNSEEMVGELSDRQLSTGFAWDPTLLTYDCSLFARKFPPSTADLLQSVMADCRNDLRVLLSGRVDVCAPKSAPKGVAPVVPASG